MLYTLYLNVFHAVLSYHFSVIRKLAAVSKVYCNNIWMLKSLWLLSLFTSRYWFSSYYHLMLLLWLSSFSFVKYIGIYLFSKKYSQLMLLLWLSSLSFVKYIGIYLFSKKYSQLLMLLLWLSSIPFVKYIVRYLFSKWKSSQLMLLLWLT